VLTFPEGAHITLIKNGIGNFYIVLALGESQFG